ncbi:hypothetical protein CRG98_020844 [Punica granatum]|uniref:Retrotransposon protein, putative, Ty1-copia subclass n=1 Tax=Punica granatum TaxID=22663 RepID=A0A2I0JR31_PUNGR|nr:hypothetical protein CRG98_020844 [Punica granatum]
MHEEKSRGSGLESRKTRLGRCGLRDPREGSRDRLGKTKSARLLRPWHGASVIVPTPLFSGLFAYKLFSYCSWFCARLFASDCRMMNSVPSFGRESSCGKPVGQNGVLTDTTLGFCRSTKCRKGDVSWKSSKQETVADSTTEAEYIAASNAAKETVWIKKFVIELAVVPSIADPVELYCDNNGDIAQAKEPRSHQRSKHILRRFHLIREIVDKGDTFGRAGTRGKTCVGMHRRGRSTGVRTDKRAGERKQVRKWARAGTRERQRAFGMFGRAGRACMHAGEGRPGSMGAANGSGDWSRSACRSERAGASARGQTCAGVTERLGAGARTSDTVHPRASSESEMMKWT